MKHCLHKVIVSSWAFDFGTFAVVNTDYDTVEVHARYSHLRYGRLRILDKTAATMGVNIRRGWLAFQTFWLKHEQFDGSAILSDELLVCNVYLGSVRIIETLLSSHHTPHHHHRLFPLFIYVFLGVHSHGYLLLEGHLEEGFHHGQDVRSLLWFLACIWSVFKLEYWLRAFSSCDWLIWTYAAHFSNVFFDNVYYIL